MEQFERDPRRDEGPARSEGKELESSMPPFREMVERVFYGNPLFPGDVPNIFGLDSRPLPAGDLRDKFDERNPAILTERFRRLGGSIEVKTGEPFLDDSGTPTRLSEVVMELPDGNRLSLLPDQIALSSCLESGRIPDPELLPVRSRLVQHLDVVDGRVSAYLTAQFDPTRTGVLDALLENAVRAQSSGREDSSFLLRALNAHLDLKAKRIIEETLSFELDDPYKDREKARVADLRYTEWRRESGKASNLENTSSALTLPGGRFEEDRTAVEFTADVRLPFGRGGRMTFGAALNKCGYLVVFTPAGHPHTL